MNQTDKIKLNEVKQALLKIISNTYGAETKYIKESVGVFNFEDVLNIISVIEVNNTYLLFDLDATRRERDQLTKILKDSNNNDQGR